MLLSVLGPRPRHLWPPHVKDQPYWYMDQFCLHKEGVIYAPNSMNIFSSRLRSEALSGAPGRRYALSVAGANGRLLTNRLSVLPCASLQRQTACIFTVHLGNTSLPSPSSLHGLANSHLTNEVDSDSGRLQLAAINTHTSSIIHIKTHPILASSTGVLIRACSTRWTITQIIFPERPSYMPSPSTRLCLDFA